MFDGDYLLTELFDENHVAVAIPPGREFRLHLASEAVNEDSTSYSFSIKIGNSMAASMTVTGRHGVTFGPVIATRMMPPPELYSIEQGLFRVLPEASFIILTDGVLTLEGSKGGVIFNTV